jgi:hypothetical protein
MKIRKALVLILMLSIVLVACGEEGDGITSKKVNEIKLRSLELADGGSCEDYSLTIKYSVLEGLDHNFKMIDLYRGMEIDNLRLGTGGTISWDGLTCDSSLPTWVEETNSCRYGVQIVADTEEGQSSYREIVVVGCDPFVLIED